MSATDKKQVKRLDWLMAQVGHSGDECLPWPYSKGPDGYGICSEGNTQFYAHRMMCELVHGAPPSDIHQAAHSCGNGRFGCVNPRHISWKTPSENQRDRRAHGTQAMGRRGYLTLAEREEIKALRGKLSQDEIAEKFNTTRSNVGYVQRRKLIKYQGVQKSGSRFLACIIIDGERNSLGVFDTPDEAAAAYQAKCAEIRNS